MTGRRAPGPSGGLIWGLLAQFRRDPLGLLAQSAAEHGDIVRLRFGPVVAHLINHPDLIEQVLSRRAAHYDKNTRSAHRIAATCGRSLLSGDRETWQRHRRLIQPTFQPRHLTGIDAIADAEMVPMLDCWTAAAAQGDSVDIVTGITRLVIGISSRALFGSAVDATRIEAALAVLLDDTWRRLQALVDPSMISDAFHRPAFRAALADVDRIVLDIIRARRRRNDMPDDLLSRLLIAHEAEGEGSLSDQELRDATVTLLLAGHETTANALAWALYLMGCNPQHGPDSVGVEAFFSETIRLYPSIWIVERRAIENEEIAGHHIPRGSSVLISPYLIHRHPAFWTAPEAFDPHRFDPQIATTRARHAYIPFGLGPHRCVGLHMARAIATQVIDTVNQRFHLTRIQGQKPEVFPGITLRHKVNFRMGISLR